MRSCNLISNTKYITGWGMFFHPRKWNTTKIHSRSPCGYSGHLPVPWRTAPIPRWRRLVPGYLLSVTKCYRIWRDRILSSYENGNSGHSIRWGSFWRWRPVAWKYDSFKQQADVIDQYVNRGCCWYRTWCNHRQYWWYKSVGWLRIFILLCFNFVSLYKCSNSVQMFGVKCRQIPLAWITKVAILTNKFTMLRLSCLVFFGWPIPRQKQYCQFNVYQHLRFRSMYINICIYIHTYITCRWIMALYVWIKVYVVLAAKVTS